MGTTLCRRFRAGRGGSVEITDISRDGEFQQEPFSGTVTQAVVAFIDNLGMEVNFSVSTRGEGTLNPHEPYIVDVFVRGVR